MLVWYNKELYDVWDDDWDERSVRLLPLNAVICYEGDGEAADKQAIAVLYRQIERIEPAEADAETVRAFFRLDVMPWELAQQGRYPFGPATHRCAITDEDLLCLIDRLPRFRNDFLLEAWRSSFQGQGTRDHLLFQERSEVNLLLNLLAERFLYMMEWLDPAEKDWLYILPLRDAYVQSRGKPIWEADIPEDFMEDLLSAMEHLAKQGGIYKLSDMYRKGDGTPQDKEKAWNLLSGLWKHTDKRNLSGGKYADIALRMGYCWRDGIGVGPDPEMALDFFVKAKKAITARLKDHPGFGDETVASNIERAIASVTCKKRRRLRPCCDHCMICSAEEVGAELIGWMDKVLR